MVTVYRLQKVKHNPTTLLGEGAKLLGGRWNFAGTPLAYTSSSGALAILELRANLGNVTLCPPLNFAVLEVPEECIHPFSVDDLPPGWATVPSADCTREFLASFLEPGNKLAFRVPSVLNPYESNILINPRHPDIDQVTIQRFDPYSFDSRLK